MKSTLKISLNISLLISLLYILCGCEDYNLSKKEFLKCTSPSASIIVKSTQKLSVQLALENPKGTIDKIAWKFNDGKEPQIGNEVSYTFASAGTYNVTVELTNNCGDFYASQIQIKVTDYESGLAKRAVPPVTGLEGAISFTIGDKIYICLGKDNTGNLSTDLFEYNTITESWATKAKFLGNGRTKASVFVIDNIAYVGLGYRGGASNQINTTPIYNELSDFWKYTPSTDTWSQIASLTTIGRASSASFSIDNKGYIVGGSNSKNSGTIKYAYFRDTWEYNPQTDVWTKRADFGGGERSDLYGVVILGKAYIGFGQTLDSQTGASTGSSKFINDLWEFNPTSKIWTSALTFRTITTRSPKIAFSIKDIGYFGHFNDSKQLTMYPYKPEKGFYDFKTYVDVIDERYDGVSVSNTTSGYFGLGSKSGQIYKDFYRFNP
jgi:hypothetical protein